MRALLTFLGAAALACPIAARVEPAGGPPSADPGSARPLVRTPRFEFGTVSGGTVVEHEFPVENRTSAPVRVVRASMTPGVELTPMPPRIEPGGTGALRVRIDTTRLRGDIDGEIVVALDDPLRTQLELSIAGRIVGALEISPLPALFLAALRGERKETSVEILNHETSPMRITKVEYPRERFSVRVEPLEQGRRYRLTLTLPRSAAVGRRTDAILVHTSSATMPVVRIPANVYVHERVHAFPDTLDLGAIPLAELRRDPSLAARLAQMVMIYRAGGRDFRAEISTDLPFLRTSTERGPAGDRIQATIALDPAALRPGPIRGRLLVRTNDPKFPVLTVPVTGAILGDAAGEDGTR